MKESKEKLSPTQKAKEEERSEMSKKEGREILEKRYVDIEKFLDWGVPGYDYSVSSYSPSCVEWYDKMFKNISDLCMDENQKKSFYELISKITIQSPHDWNPELNRDLYNEIYSRQPLKGVKILEIGGGIGAFGLTLTALGAEVVNIDPSATSTYEFASFQGFAYTPEDIENGKAVPFLSKSSPAAFERARKNGKYWGLPIMLNGEILEQVEKGRYSKEIWIHPEGKEAYEYKLPSGLIKKLLTQKYDLVISMRVMDRGSGITREERRSSKELLEICAKLTKDGGYNIHEGDVVPTDKEFLKDIHLTALEDIETHWGGALLKKISQEEKSKAE